MIYVVYGDPFRSNLKVREITDRFRSVTDNLGEVISIDAEDSSSDRLISLLEAPSLFPVKRLFVIERPSLGDAAVQRFFSDRMEVLAHAKDTFVFWEPGDDLEKSGLWESFESYAAKVQQVKAFTPQSFVSWLNEEARMLGTPLSRTAEQYIVSRAGGDPYRAIHELEIYTLSQGAEVTASHNNERSNALFAFTDALGDRRVGDAMRLLHQFITEGIAPERILWTVVWHIKNLAVCADLAEKNISETEAIKSMRQHPFVVKKSFKQARHFSQKELARMYKDLVVIDRDAKIAKKDPRIGLEQLVLSLA